MSTATATPPTDTDRLLAALAIVERRLHQLEVTVRCKVEAPADSLPLARAAKLLGCCQKTLKRRAAEGVFTDARPPDRRRAGTPRQFYTDELAEYRAGGELGVARLREELGRD